MRLQRHYLGLIWPGLLQVALEMGEKFGRMMNYGDGLYAGQFVAAMWTAGFFESDPEPFFRVRFLELAWYVQ